VGYLLGHVGTGVHTGCGDVYCIPEVFDFGYDKGRG